MLIWEYNCKHLLRGSFKLDVSASCRLHGAAALACTHAWQLHSQQPLHALPSLSLTADNAAPCQSTTCRRTAPCVGAVRRGAYGCDAIGRIYCTDGCHQICSPSASFCFAFSPHLLLKHPLDCVQDAAFLKAGREGSSQGPANPGNSNGESCHDTRDNMCQVGCMRWCTDRLCLCICFMSQYACSAWRHSQAALAAAT